MHFPNRGCLQTGGVGGRAVLLLCRARGAVPGLAVVLRGLRQLHRVQGLILRALKCRFKVVLGLLI